MLKRLALCIVLASCAASPVLVAPPLGVSLSCSANTVLVCPPFGCTSALPGETQAGFVSLGIPAQGEIGRICEAGGCGDARYLPTLTRALGWTADVYVGPGMALERGEVEIASDRGSFHWRRQDRGALYVWRGTCQAAGS